MRLRFTVLLFLSMIAPAEYAASIELAPGDLLSVGVFGGGSHVSVLRVDPVSGDRVVIFVAQLHAASP